MICEHKWVRWDGLCDDWRGMEIAEICIKCWKHSQKNINGDWFDYGYLDPDGAWVKDIKEKYCDSETNKNDATP